MHRAIPTDRPHAALPKQTATQFAVRFWGVRGAIPTPGESTHRYGGNTACVEVKIANQRLIFDAGTGLRVLGEHIIQAVPPADETTGHLFLTQTQWDRIQGFPFFPPAFDPRYRFCFYGAPAQTGASIKQQLTAQLLRPNCLVSLQAMQAALAFHDILAGSTVAIADVRVETTALNPATCALGYRVTWHDKSLVYATDTDPHRLDPNLIEFAHRADILIYDGTYADSAYPASRSSRLPSPKCPPNPLWKTAVALAKAAQVRQLVLFHYSPDQTDSVLDSLAQLLQAKSHSFSLAREGLTLYL